MKKMMMITAGAITLGAIAQDMELPPPPVTSPSASVTVEIAVPPPPPVVDAVPIVDLEPGALCKTYFVQFGSRNGSSRFVPAIGSQALYDQMMDAVEHAVATDVSYDVDSARFDAQRVAKHKSNVAVWEGFLEAKRQGSYIFTVNSGLDYRVEVNDAFAFGVGQKTFVVNLNAGVNRVKIIRLIATNSELEGHAQPMGYREKKKFSLEYRLATSSKPSRSITPSMLKHVVEEEEVW